MAAAAAGKALGEAGLPPGEVSLVLVTTMSNLRQAPPLAAELAFRIGATDAGALDTGAGCAGFCYTLAVAADAIRSGSARHVVVVGVERMTDIVDPTDRGTAFLFGDGAGAVVVGPAAEPGVGPVRWGSDGSRAAAIAQPYSWAAVRDDPTTPAPTLRMAGQEVFRWAVTALAPIAADAIRLAGLTAADIDVFVPHQANMRITDSLVRGIGLRAGRRRGPGHRHRRQHLVGLDPAGDRAAAGVRPGPQPASARCCSASAPGCSTRPRWSASPRPVSQLPCRRAVDARTRDGPSAAVEVGEHGEHAAVVGVGRGAGRAW